jgi:diaminopimelate dehydrogenase
MKKFRAAVVGYGNIGKFTVEALEAAPDFEIAGIVRRQGAKDKPAELANYEVVDDITKLKDVDVAILATPTRSCPEYAEKIVALGINTVDSFDIHTSILDYRTKQMENCKKAGKVSVISAGWDPGSDSIVRVLMESLAPKGLTYTNFGPGMSMGHPMGWLQRALPLRPSCYEHKLSDPLILGRLSIGVMVSLGRVISLALTWRQLGRGTS